MKTVQLRFGKYVDITKSGQDGTSIQFPFEMTVGGDARGSEQSYVKSQHLLSVGVAARTNWGNDEAFLARVLFEVGKQELVGKLYLQIELSEVETVFIPHGDCPVDANSLSDPDGAILEIEIL